MDIDEFAQKDTALRHALQTGIKIEQETEGDAEFYRNNPTLADIIKHLRVGLNCAMVEHSTIIRLLIKKKMITEDEYFDQALQDLTEEKERVEKKLSSYYGRKITLG